MGAGNSDSNIDVALSSSSSPDGSPSPSQETLLQILCCKDDLRTSNSHHDAILSSIPLNFMDSSSQASSSDVPTMENNRHRIIWSEENLQNYCDLIHPVLADLQATWLDDSPSPSSISVLLQQTNTVLSSAAKFTQKVIPLNRKPKPKKVHIPSELVEASSTHNLSHKNLKQVLKNPSSSKVETDMARLEFSKSRASLQRVKRQANIHNEALAAQKLHTILSSNPRSLFTAVKSNKRDSVSINKLSVGDDLYVGDDVGKGFFRSISALKSRDDEILHCPTFKVFLSDHSHILEICREGQKIPPLSFSQAEKLLKSIKPSVTDIYNTVTLLSDTSNSFLMLLLEILRTLLCLK